MDLNVEKRIRMILLVFSSILSIILCVFVWIMMDASSNEMSAVLRKSMVLVVSVSSIAQGIYALKGQIFEIDGRLAKYEILFAIISVQIVMQFCFGFSLYAVNQITMQNESFDSAYEHFISIQQAADGNTPGDYMSIDLEKGKPPFVEAVFLADDSSGDSSQHYHFPISGGKILMQKSQSYFAKHLLDFTVSMLMSLIISVFLMIELVYFAVKYLNDYQNKIDYKTSVNPVEYLRQMAFLFYMAGYLSTAFIPIMTRNLSNSPNADFIAGLPYSVEALANCVALLLATQFFRKEGWKPPYLVGISIYVCGVVMSALSSNVFTFIASRAVAGLGYGFCWMTLRNMTAISGDRASNFSDLSSGIYAGIMCGGVFGAVLADSIGYRGVLLVSAALTVIASLFPLILSNEKGILRTEQMEKRHLTKSDLLILTVFLIAIVIPASIAEAFRSYVVPLHINALQLPTMYVGRVSLIYNLCIVYVSSTLLIKLVKKVIKNNLLQNALHIFMISLALFSAAYLGGLSAMVFAAMLLGSADGFGFSVQNAYILDTKVGKKLGSARMLTYFSLFKKFGAMFAPGVFALFMNDGRGVRGLGAMGIVFIICMIVGVSFITLYNYKDRRCNT